MWDIQLAENVSRYLDGKGMVEGSDVCHRCACRGEAIDVVHEHIGIVVLGEAGHIEIAQRRQALADREGHVAEIRRLAGDAEFELRRAVAAAAYEDDAFEPVVDHS